MYWMTAGGGHAKSSATSASETGSAGSASSPAGERASAGREAPSTTKPKSTSTPTRRIGPILIEVLGRRLPGGVKQHCLRRASRQWLGGRDRRPGGSAP